MQMSQFTPSPSKDRVIAILGDSGAGDTGTGIDEFACYPALLVNRLNEPALGRCAVRESRNAFSGRGTANSIVSANQGQSSFRNLLPPYEDTMPALAVVQFGVNDPGGLTLAVTSITRSGTTATVTMSAPHPFVNGQNVTHAGVTAGALMGTLYNITAPITFVDFYTYTYTVDVTATTPATGSPTAQGAISTATTTTNLEAIILGLLGGANVGVVGYPANLPAGSPYGHFEQTQPDRCVVYSDNDSTGGVPAALYSYSDPVSGYTTLPTITGASTGVTLWENVFEGGSGGVASWRRIMSLSTLSATPTLVTPGIQYVMINGAWYLNWASLGGDNTKTCTGITRSGTTATATVTSHGWSNGDHVNMVNASDSNLNGSYIIANAVTNTFDYTVANTGATSVGACNATKMYTTYDDLSGGVRFAQKAAVAAFGATDRVKYCDQWAYEQSLITSGKVTALSDLFSLAAGNQHRNKAGHGAQAAKLYADIVAWTTLYNILKANT